MGHFQQAGYVHHFFISPKSSDSWKSVYMPMVISTGFSDLWVFDKYIDGDLIHIFYVKHLDGHYNVYDIWEPRTLEEYDLSP